MKNKIIKFNTISMVKFMFLVGLYYIIICFFSKYNEGGDGTIYQIALQTIEENAIDNADGVRNAKIFIKIFEPFRDYFLYLCGLGIILNVISDLIVNKTKWTAVIKLIGTIKLLTLAPITGIMMLIYNPNKNLECEKSYLEKPINESSDTTFNEPLDTNSVNLNMDHNPPKKISQTSTVKYNHHVPSFSPLSLLLFVFYICIALIAFNFGGIGILVAIVGIVLAFSNLCGKGNKKRIFKKCCDMVKENMPVEEVQNIMRKFTPINAGYDRHNDYVLQYKVKFFEEYESIQFTFTNGYLVEINKGYKRIS